MNIATFLSEGQRQENWRQVIDYIGDNTDKLDELMQLVFNGNERLVKYSVHIMGIVAEKQAHLFIPYVEKIVNLLTDNPIEVVKRNVLRLFQYVEITEEIESDLFEITLNFLKSMDEPIAVKAFGMTVLRRICEKYPELSSEVIHVIELLVEEKVSKGITSRGTRELKRLRNLTQKIN